MDRAGAKPVVKIAEFGTACKLSDATVVVDHAAERYLPPEALRSQKNADAASRWANWDAWSFACIAFEVLLGIKPYGCGPRGALALVFACA